MSTTIPNPDSTPAEVVEEAGEKVTGGEDTSENAPSETTDEPAGEEYTPSTETTKEEVAGYNELPEQEKVGGA